ncbi:MAG: reverse transcriptase domain-containing protein [Anaerolineales bacterium]
MPDEQGVPPPRYPRASRWPTPSQARRCVHDLWEPLSLSDGRDLYHLMFGKDILMWAWLRVSRKPGRNLAGIDGRTVRQIQRSGVTEFLEDLRAALKQGRYSPMRTWTRSLPGRESHIRAVQDRVVESALGAILRPLFDYHPHAVAYRPRCSPRSVLEILSRYGMGFDLGVRLDISHAFGEIRHDWVMSQVAIKAKDRKVLGLVEMLLASAGTDDPWAKYGRPKGIGQGTAISTVLFEIAMRPVDALFPVHPLHPRAVSRDNNWTDRRKDPAPAVHVRYGDDILVLVAGGRAQGIWHRDRVEAACNQMGVRLNHRKSQMAPLTKGMDFLGLNFRWPGPRITVSEERIVRWASELDKSLGSEETTKRLIQSKRDWLQMMGADVNDARTRLSAALARLGRE